MLDANVLEQLRGHFAAMEHQVELVLSLDETPTARELLSLVEAACSTSEKLSWRAGGSANRTPSVLVQRLGGISGRVEFAGVPLGHEFTSFVLAVLQAGGVPPRISDEVLRKVRAVRGELRFETFYSQSCQNCPDVVQALNVLSVLNESVSHVAIDGAVFQEEVAARNVLAVPAVFLNGELFSSGRASLEELLLKLGEEGDDAESFEHVEPYDVLIVGGGPAGSSAAVYASRKGVRTGVVAARFGGQVLDTMSIENLVGVPHTDGPRLARSLEEHVREYDVDIRTPYAAKHLHQRGADGLFELELERGGSLKARSVVLAPGASWRTLGVPGEAEYRNRGVTFCPHCDGPLFKGERVVVVGGGNSGVEAALDLAGVVGHVTVLEYGAELRADMVLQDALRSRGNVSVVLNAQTVEVAGDGSRVSGVRYIDRVSGAGVTVDARGVFIQIGLVPNTSWLDGVVAMNERGEIVVDDRGRTSLEGVFAAGDATTAPYKQIVTALGSGATAALGAFEHLTLESSQLAGSLPG
jgi:alkyl hydroperoxide reductase subunit F